MIISGLDEAFGSGDSENGFGSSTTVGSNNSSGSSPNWRDLAASRDDPLMQMDWDLIITLPAGCSPIEHEYVEEIHVPMAKYDSESVTYQARKYYYAKFEEFGVAGLKLYETRKMAMTRALRSWQSKIKDNKGNYRPPRAYKGTIIVWPKDATQTSIAKITLHGVFPTVVPNLDFTSGGDRHVLDVELSIDKVEIEFL